MSVVSVKVSPKTKKEMERLREKVEWPSEIRTFIEDRVEQAKREETLERFQKRYAERPQVPKGTAARLVREDRDHGH
jgi:hypothetical protein